MPIFSNDTMERIQAVLDKAGALMDRIPGLTRPEALTCVALQMTTKEIIKLKELSDKIDARQEQEIQAEKRALAAYASTFKSNVDVDK